MQSLKSLLPQIAPVLGTTPYALYERQRALVRAGLLKARPGRGRGSGVEATSHALAILLISVTATSSLTEVPEATKIFANLKSEEGKCPFTGKKTLGAAFTAVLDSEDLVNRAYSLQCLREWNGSYRAQLLIRKEPGQFYTEDELKQLAATKAKIDREKLRFTLASGFRLPRKEPRALSTIGSLDLSWLYLEKTK